MASAWGSSWGSAWGNSWGSLGAAQPPAAAGGRGSIGIWPHPEPIRDNDDDEVAAVLAAAWGALWRI
jgi:hypothetical protein